jgi:hypothetical protein
MLQSGSRESCAALPLVLVVLAGCGDGSSSCPPEPLVAIEAPSEEEWRAATEGLTSYDGPDGDTFELDIDLGACESGRWFSFLPLGSAWVQVVASGSDCQIWLGGETENPNYDGRPTQYCLLPRSCGVVTAAEAFEFGGGPAVIESPFCVSPGVR